MTVPFNPFAGPAIDRSAASTDGQREIWTAVQMGSDASLAYNEAVALRLRGALDVAALQSAVGTLVARHDSLRATFSRDGLTMLVAEADAPVIARHDWSGESADERTVSQSALFSSLVSIPFDLASGPLVRFALVTVQPDEHLLCISAHHIICDGWSFGVIAADIGALYEAAVASRAAMLPAPERYTDYAAALISGDAATARSDDEAYWVQRFARVPEPLELPGDRQRPVLKSYPSAREDVHLPAALVRELKALGAKTGSSLFATLLAGFASLLYRLTSQDDLVVGIASAGQSASQRPQLVGHCVNTLPIRLQPTAELPFDEFVPAVRSASFDAFDHQSVGFGRVVERLAIPRDPSRVPLVSVVFNLDRALTAEALAFGGLDVSLESVPRVAENFDLFVNAIEVADGMVLECQYNTDLYDGSTVRRWLGSFETLLRAAAETPSAAIGRLAIRTAEDDATLARCNDTALVVPSGRLVHELVEIQAAATPARVAVEADDVTLTYADLDARANQLARALRAAGVGRGALVGLCVERTPAMLVALLGILKSGAGYVPLDPSYPADRLRHMTEDASLAALITEESVRRELALTAPVIVSLDGDVESLAAYPVTPLPRDVQTAMPDDPAYVIFTSGSTGRPKGVLVPHRSVVNLLMSVRTTPGMSSEDVVLAITTLSFDIAVSELLLPLTVGARIVLTTRDTASDGALLRAVIESRGITFIDATPATYRLLLAAGWSGSSRLRLICTGEALPRELAPELLSRSRELWNGYGPTETTVWSTFARVEAPVRRVLIGRPVANTQVAIRDRQGEQVPIGVPGELFIGGGGVATGYLGRPDLTAERFSTDPDVPSRRWYRTGDLVRLLPSGELECLGRTDDQVKIRGYRIEPGEIAAVISRWPGVRQAVVVARELRANDLRLVAFVVADDTVMFDDAFRAELRRTLPDYMMPAAVVRLERLPLTPSGKVDKKNLPAVDAAAAAPATTFVAPRTPSEELLAGLWAEALGVSRVSVEDDFFALGGHSLLASQILSRLRRDHGIEITFRRIFESPTVAGLAARLDADLAAGTGTAPKASIPHRPDSVWSPLSALQERLWLLEELEPSRRPAHSHPASWQLTGPLDTEALATALRAFVLRHPMLRTSFHWQDGERRQQVHADVAFTMQQLDLSALSEAEQGVALDAFFIDAQAVPFDLDAPPLFRATLIRLGETTHRLYTLQHGMVWDGWSFDLFLHDLSALYTAAVERRPELLPALTVDYGDFAAWQQSWLTSPAADLQRAWWQEQLAGVRDGVSMPVDHPRPLSSTHVGDQLSLVFDADEVDQLYKLARAHDGTLFMVLFAAFSVLLQRYSGQRDLLIASPMRARTRPELEGVVGPFVNTVVFRTPIPPLSTFADLIRAVRERALDTYGNQELPFELLGARMPTIGAVFSMQDARERPKTMGPLAVRQVHVPLRFASNDLTLWMVQFPQHLTAVLNFSSDVIDRPSAQAFLDQLRTLLHAVMRTPDVPLESVGLLEVAEAAAERTLPPAHAAAPSVLEHIAQFAAATPSATAIRGGRDDISFAALWQRSGQVGAALQARGVHPGDPVTVELTSSADRLIAIVGALRAGARVAVIPTDEAAEYQALMRAAIAPRARIAAAPLTDTATTLTLAEAGQTVDDTAPASQAGAGLALTWPDGTGGLERADVSMARVDAQVAALVAHVTSAPAGTVLHAVQQLSVAYVPTILTALAAGRTVALVDDAVINDPLDFSDEARTIAPTALLGTAEAWRGTLDADWRSGVIPVGVIVGGGLSPDELRTIAGRGTECVATSGSAADAAITTLHRVAPEGENWFAGAGVGGAALRVLDDAQQPLPLGMPGLLWWACAGDTAWQRSGGRARRSATGQIQMLPDGGATVWLGGSPVDAVVIETMLREVPGVMDAAVVAHRDKRGVPSLVAYVTPAPGASPDAASVRTRLRGRVPRDYIPARIVMSSVIARADSGAPQRNTLPSPFTADAAQAESATPQGDNERVMADVWQEVLGLVRVGRDDNFFGLGGTSLLCFRAIETVRRRTGVRISPRALLTGTLSQAAAQLTATQG